MKRRAITSTSTTDDTVKLDRKRERWQARNKDKLEEENPFVKAIRPPYNDGGEDLKRRLENFEFGNYPGYFNYRNQGAPKDTGETSDLTDSRLTILRADWFTNKAVLDVGCNRGHITYYIARKYSPKFIVGIDIDSKMIRMANKDLHIHLEDGVIMESDAFRKERAAQMLKETEEKPDQYTEDLNHFPLQRYVSKGPLILFPKVRDNCDRKCETKLRFPNNILFVEHDYVLKKDELVDKQKESFDTVVCLSVTKWVHLNYGDDGIKRFFKRIFKHLNEDGLLILETQPFENYNRKKKLSERLRNNYHSIKLKPEQFDDFLLSSEVGFRQILHSATTDHQFAGFKRPLKVFLK